MRTHIQMFLKERVLLRSSCRPPYRFQCMLYTSDDTIHIAISQRFCTYHPSRISCIRSLAECLCCSYMKYIDLGLDPCMSHMIRGSARTCVTRDPTRSQVNMFSHTLCSLERMVVDSPYNLRHHGLEIERNSRLCKILETSEKLFVTSHCGH